jgi:hypothetical protein
MNPRQCKCGTWLLPGQTICGWCGASLSSARLVPHPAVYAHSSRPQESRALTLFEQGLAICWLVAGWACGTAERIWKRITRKTTNETQDNRR